MNTNKKLIGLLAVIAVIISGFGFAQAKQNTINAPKQTGTLMLSESEIEGLIQMREEEKLARDVYTTLGETWGLNIFYNIAISEQTHTDAVKNLLDRYGIEDPVKDDSIGVFTSPAMTELYDALVEQGEKSLLDALIVGASIEDLDINDLNELLDDTDNPDIINVYQNLREGSYNHLRAFVSQIESRGGEYELQYISQELYDQIITSVRDRGTPREKQHRLRSNR